MKETNKGRAKQEKKDTVLPICELSQPYNKSNPAKVFSRPDDFKEQGKIFKKNTTAEFEDSAEYVRLGCNYRKQGEYDRAEKTFQRAIEIDQENDNAYVELAWNYIFGQNGTDPKIIEGLFKRGIKINLINYNAYLGLGRFYTYQGNSNMANEMFEKAIKVDPKNEIAYIELGELYGSKKEYHKSIEMLGKALELNPKNDKIYRRLAFYYNVLGEYENAKEINNKANRLILEYYDSILCYNYRKLKDIVTNRRVKLLCVQYPMRSIEPLKFFFQDKNDIIFVDNEKVFKKAVKRDGYNEYFDDMFGGDFGHCTAKGNRLLAENIANVIVKEYFRK